MSSPEVFRRCDTLHAITLYPYHFSSGIFAGGFVADDLVENARMPTPNRFRDQPLQQGAAAHAHHKGRYLFAGPLWNHFGHVLVDCLHRLWAAIENPGAFDGIVFSHVYNLRAGPTVQLPAFLRDFLTLMGVGDIPLVLVDAPTSFDCVVVPQPGSIWKLGVQPFYWDYLKGYQQIIAQAAGPLDSKVPPRLHYGRSHALRDGGIIGGSYFEHLLKEAGFVSCVPEDMSLRLQFAYIMNARQIVFDEGSALHLTELLHDVPGDIRMLPRRPGDKVFRTALIPRARSFENVAGDSNIVLMCDRNGQHSPAALTLYKDPAVVHARLARTCAIAPFDALSYDEHERGDLARCPAGSSGVRARWNNQLAEYRTTIPA